MDSFHGRFLILDGTEGYLVGASLKDAVKRSFAITRLEGEQPVRDVLSTQLTDRPEVRHPLFIDLINNNP